MSNIFDLHFPGETLVYLCLFAAILFVRNVTFKKSVLFLVIVVFLSLLIQYDVSLKFIYGLLYILLPLIILTFSLRFNTKSAWFLLYMLWYANLSLDLFELSGFSHTSYLPTYGSVLFGMIYLVKKQRNTLDWITIASIALFLVFSLSLKAIATVVLYFLLNSSKISSLIRSGILVSLSTILLYMSIPELQDKIDIYLVRYGVEFAASPRGILYLSGLNIAIDYFPFGSGAGSFGSPSAIIYQSNIYSAYNISGHGLEFSKIDTNNFFYDAFWSGILGELGFLFTLIYLFVLFGNYRKVNRAKIFVVTIFFQSLWTHFINDLSLFLTLFILIPIIIHNESVVYNQ